MSQIATSIVQSKRLLDAGVPEESADILCYHEELVLDPVPFPAWSLSALWQMVYELDRTYEFPTELSADELIETLVSTIVYRRTH